MFNITNYIIMIKFLVNDISYSIALEQINDFPIKNAYLNTLVNHYLNGTIGVQLKNDHIIINSDYHNFDKIVMIYNNPMIKLADIINGKAIVFAKKYDSLFSTYKSKDEYHTFIYHNYDSVKQELNNAVMNDQQVDLLIEELEFYGVYDLFINQSNDVNINQLTKKINRTLRSKFRYSHDDYHNFIEQIRRFGGYISGSCLLQSILNEKWNSDIDVYINDTMLMNYCIRKFDTSKYSKKLAMKDFRNFLDQEYDKIIDRQHIINVANDIAKLFGPDFTVDKTLDTKEYWKNEYDMCHNLCGVIKLKYHELSIDLVIVNCTVPYFIQGFDFTFNKIYFDTYTIHAFHWNDIYAKRSANLHKLSRYNISYVDKYMENIKRIYKYMCRGFIITWYNTKDESQVNSLFDKYKDDQDIDDQDGDATTVYDYSIDSCRIVI